MDSMDSRTINFDQPTKNGKWQFVLCEGCYYEETGTRLTKLVMSTAFQDGRDIAQGHFAVKTNESGTAILARSPDHPAFLYMNAKENFGDVDDATLKGHELLQYRMVSASVIDDRTSWTRYNLPPGFTVTAQYYNANGKLAGPPAMDEDGMFSCIVKNRFYHQWVLPPNPNHPKAELRPGQQTTLGFVFAELAIKESIKHVNKQAEEDPYSTSFQQAFQMSKL